MKLFALAATTAVTARRRVDQPAPGFINEQGGYWADQPTQQSNQYQQPPQPNYQQQQGQKPQCAAGYHFTAPGQPESVFMAKAGENDDKPYYTGFFEGKEKYLYWAWNRQSNPTNAPVMAVPGNWFFGSSIGDDNAIASSTTYGLRYCPTDHETRWVYSNVGSTLIGDPLMEVSSPKESVVSLTAGQSPSHDEQHPWQVFRCCNTYELTLSTGEIVTMSRRSQVHDMRTYYSGVQRNGVEQFLYFGFVRNSFTTMNWRALDGKWFLGNNDPNDIEDSRASEDPDAISTGAIPYGFTSCPTDPNVMKTFDTTLNLQCKKKNIKVRTLLTCDTISDRSIFNGNEDECILSRALEQMVRIQFEQLTTFRPDAEDKGVDFFNKIPVAVKALADNGCIETTGTSEYYKPYVQGCSKVCANITDLTQPKDMGPVLKSTWDLIASIYKETADSDKCKIAYNNLRTGINGLSHYTGQKAE